MAEPYSVDHIARLVTAVADQAHEASAHRTTQLVDELDMLAEDLVGRYDEPAVAQKAAIQRLVEKLAPHRIAKPAAG